MITTDSTQQSVPLALQAAKKGLAITAVSGTPVDEMCKITHNFLNEMPVCTSNSGEDIGQEQLLSEASYISSVTEGDTGSLHNATMDEVINTLSIAVSSHLSFAKNVVSPTVSAVVDSVERFLTKEKNPALDFKVDVHDVPEPMLNSGFEDSVSKFAGKVYLAPEQMLQLKPLAPQEILELLKTGSSLYDQKVEHWFAKMGDGWFLNVWNNFFADTKQVKIEKPLSFEEAMFKDPETDDYCLAVYLLSRKLYDEVLEGTAMTLSSYKNLVAQYREASAIRLLACFNNQSNILKNKTLVKSYSVDRKTISVNGPVYRQWLEADTGNTNEVLLGLLVSNMVLYASSLVDSKRIELLQNWVNYSNLSKITSKNKTFVLFKEAIAAAFETELNSPLEQEKEFIQANSQYKESVKSLFNKEMQELTPAAMDDVFNTCTKIVCRARFYYTDSEKILCGINHAMKMNPAMDVRQAALMSTIEYVCDYLGDQLQLG